MTLTEFLLARIAEDEGRVEGVFQGVDPDFFWGPDRIRAECEAKRLVMEEHSPVDYTDLGMRSPNACHICGADRSMGDWEWDENSFPCLTLRALAATYADHPDYDESWRP